MIHLLHHRIHLGSQNLLLIVDSISLSTPGCLREKHQHYSSAIFLGDSERSLLLSLDPKPELTTAIADAVSAIAGKD